MSSPVSSAALALLLAASARAQDFLPGPMAEALLGAHEEMEEGRAPRALLGPWVTEDGEALLVEADRVGRLRGGRAVFYRTCWSEHRVELESWGRVEALSLELTDAGLHATSSKGDVTDYRRADRVPAELRVEPLDLPPADEVEVDDDLRAVLLDDLRTRRAEDQRVRQGSPDWKSMRAVDEDNTEFLLGLLPELGWIDATRFGPEAADAAFLLVQHSGHLRLMKTALPLIEQDVTAGHLDGQAFALLHDRLALNLGHRQRYGSQLATLESGESVLMPCEDLERVDEYRRSMGMGPLAEYLSHWQKSPQDAPVRSLEEALAEAPAGERVPR